jgi:hypothetical protein
MDEQEMIKTNSNFLVTETTLDPKLPVEKVVEVLRERRTIGQLVLHLSQGAVQKIALVERTKAEGHQVTQIREVLGME